jgi:type IV secretory pathway VirB3-like protein
MSENLVRLKASPVFTGLLRQPQFFGVDYNYCVLSGMLSILAFLDLSSWGIFLFLPLHILGWLFCQMDPHIFSLLKVRARIGVIKNYRIWGVQTYEPW